MKNIITIPVYNKDIEFTHNEIYTITYIHSKKVNVLRIIVNGLMSTSDINLLDFNEGYKSRILTAISQYKNGKLYQVVGASKFLSLDYMKSLYSKNVIKKVEDYLLPINSEKTRDILTKYNLI